MSPDTSRGRILLGLGLLMLAAGTVYCGTTAAFLDHAERTKAVVDDPGPGGRHPVLHFRLPSGHNVQIVAGGVFKPVHAGDTVDVVYDPASPAATAELDTVAALWTPAILLFTMGGSLVGLGTHASHAGRN